jgi:hypothetical protein
MLVYIGAPVHPLPNDGVHDDVAIAVLAHVAITDAELAVLPVMQPTTHLK